MHNRSRLILILGLLTAIGPFSIDMYLPAFSDIAKDLHTSVAHVTLSLSSFFIGISVGQFLYGPLLDRFGRKRPVYIGLAIYLFTSILCVFARSADELIVLRFVQAIGGCAGMVAARAMVRDLFAVEENAKVFSMLMLVVAVSPIVAPTLGGYITAAVGWHYVFAALALLSVIIIYGVYRILPHTREPDTSVSLKPLSILRGFRDVLVTPQFYTHAFAGALASAGLYAYIAGSPYVFMELFGVSERGYGWIFAFVAAGLITASQINSRMLKYYTSQQIIRVSLGSQALIGILLVTGTYFQVLGLYSTIGCIFLYLSCQGFTFPNTSALSMAPFSKNAGAASALLGTIQMGIGAGSSALVSYLSDHTAIPMTGMMSACVLASLSVLLIGRRIIRYKARLADVKDETVEMISNS